MFPTGISERLENAAATAKAAEVYSEAGNIEQARTIFVDVERPLYEVTTYLLESIRPIRSEMRVRLIEAIAKARQWVRELVSGR
jgi:hypothetical protein